MKWDKLSSRLTLTVQDEEKLEDATEAIRIRKSKKN